MAAITMRDWYGDGFLEERRIPAEDYRADIACLKSWGEELHEWVGRGRNGGLLKVVWVTRPVFGLAVLISYEIG